MTFNEKDIKHGIIYMTPDKGNIMKKDGVWRFIIAGSMYEKFTADELQEIVNKLNAYNSITKP